MPDTKIQPTATSGTGQAWLRLLAAVACIVGALAYTLVTVGEVSLILVLASGIGMYMAMNIGANDVANNVGPAVGARAMSLTQAILIAAVFEALGAIIAGGEVVTTIKGGIIDAAQIDDAATFVWLMGSALLAGALWLNLATWLGAPVSTTHSIVGGVLGAGVDISTFTIDLNYEIGLSEVFSEDFTGGTDVAKQNVVRGLIGFRF